MNEGRNEKKRGDDSEMKELWWMNEGRNGKKGRREGT